LDDGTEGWGIGVVADNGIVRLTGIVTSWTIRLAAQETALRVAGVSDVKNEIAVWAPESRRKDAEIQVPWPARRAEKEKTCVSKTS
jgi:osmotically-inducible protein OsmY